MSGRSDVQFVTIHGHRRAFVKVGRGPALLLLHGLGCDHTTWAPVLEALSRHHTVIAPDLLGHGRSDKPRADYTVGGYANGMRDLLTVLGTDRVTVVGHSFGGGVAMQYAYQFPERVERLVLVAPGGLGPEVTGAIRAITTPGFDQAMSLLTLPGLRHLGVAALRALSRAPSPMARDLDEVAGVYESFKDRQARAAIRHVVRGTVDWRGQIITMADRSYLAEQVPTCVIWGREDRVIPVSHADRAAELAPWARVEVFADCGHFPHKDHPQRFARVVHEFVQATRPGSYSQARFRAQLLAGSADGDSDGLEALAGA